MSTKARLLFLKNAAILTGTSFLLRIIGMIFRIYLSSRIGAEGMGLYQLIFSVYLLAATFASSGLTVAVTRLVSALPQPGSRAAVPILRKVSILGTVLGLLAAGTLFQTAPWISRYLLHDLRAQASLRVLSVSLPFIALSACMRGYFLACRNAALPSAAQLLEQFSRIGITVWFLHRFSGFGIVYSCFGVMLGNTLSEILSCLFSLIGCVHSLRSHDPAAMLPPPTFRQILHIVLPISGAGVLASGLRTVENLLVPDALSDHLHSREDALAQFGALKGMAMPLLFFPSAFLSALSVLLLPEISRAAAQKDQKRLERLISLSVQSCFVLSFLPAALFFLFAEELSMLLYRSDAITLFLRVLGPLMPIIYLESIVDGILKGLDQQVYSLCYSVSDSALRIALVLLIVPRFGIKGFLGMMVFSNLYTSGLNLRRLLRVSPVSIKPIRFVVLPSAFIILSVFLSHYILNRFDFSGFLLLVSQGLLISGSYLLLLVVSRTLRISEFRTG